MQSIKPAATFLLEWNDDNGQHQFRGSATDIMKELVPFFQGESERGKVDAFLAVANVGQKYEEPARYTIQRLA